MLDRQSLRCLGSGFIALDVIRSARVESGELRFAGGSCGNVLTILSFLGCRSTVVGRIGNDPAGSELLGDLARWTVDTRWITREETRPTPIVFQHYSVDSEGNLRHRFKLQCPKCGDWAARYRPLRIAEARGVQPQLPSAEVFYFDRVAPANTEMAKRARDAGALVVFEPPSVSNESHFRECLGLSHVFKFADRRFDEVSHWIEQAGVPVVVRTLGAAGLELTMRSGEVTKNAHLPALRAPRFVDASGSGDWCTAGLVYSLGRAAGTLDSLLLDESSVVEAIRFGQSLASLNCAFEGARGLMYTVPSQDVLHAASTVIQGGEVDLPEQTAGYTCGLEPSRGSDCIVCHRTL